MQKALGTNTIDAQGLVAGSGDGLSLSAVRACTIGTHLSGESWRKLLHEAHIEAQQGAKEFMLLRFPSEVCTDGGRAINAPDLEGFPSRRAGRRLSRTNSGRHCHDSGL